MAAVRWVELLIAGTLLLARASCSQPRRVPISHVCYQAFDDKIFNLTSMIRAPNAPFSVASNSGTVYTFNVCGTPVGGCGANGPSAACASRMGGMKTAIGNQAQMSLSLLSSADISQINQRTQEHNPNFPTQDWGIKMMFPPLAQGDEVVSVLVPCDPSATNAVLSNKPGMSYLLPVSAGTSGGYMFVVPSPAGCPVGENDEGGRPDDGSSDGISGGWVFIILLLGGTLCYCIAGIVFKTQKYGVTGAEAIPNIEFWQDLPLLISDGCSFTYQTIAGLLGVGGADTHYGNMNQDQGPANSYPPPVNQKQNDFAISSYNDL